MLEPRHASGFYRNIEALELLSDLFISADKDIDAIKVSGLGQICLLIKKDLEECVAEADKRN